MPKNNRLRFLLLGLFLPLFARGADHWEKLKAGMSTFEAEAVLGHPLIRNEGNGFELWIYDRGAEAVFYGSLIAWTVPTDSKASNSPDQAWDFSQGLPDQIVVPFPKKKSLDPAQPFSQHPIGQNATSFQFLPKF